MATTDGLLAWASAHEVPLKLHKDLDRVHTVRQAAEVLGVEEAAIAKSVVFDNDGKPLVVLAPGDGKVRERLVIDHVGGVRNRFRMASPEQVLEWTGYPVGGVPPFGHPTPIRTLMDERLLEIDPVIFGGGTSDTLIELHPQDVRRVTDAEVGRFVA